MDKIVEKMNALHERLSCSVFFGGEYTSYSDEKEGRFWKVNLTYRDEETRIEHTAKGRTFAEALERAWHRIEEIADNGLPYGALQPAVHHNVIEPPRTEHQDPNGIDGIPF